MSVLSILKYRFLKRYYAARFISNFGNGMGPVALAFGVLHLRNGSPSILGLVLASATIPMLIMSPFGGVIADKFGRAQIGRAHV